MHGPAPNRNIINNMLSIIIDPERLGTGANLAQQTAAFIDWVKASPVAQDVDRIKIAGEPENDHRRQRGAAGIPVDATTWREIIDAGAALGVDRATVERLAAIAT